MIVTILEKNISASACLLFIYQFSDIWFEQFLIDFTLFTAHHSSSTLNQHITPATNALDDRGKSGRSQHNTYGSAHDSLSNREIIKESEVK